MTIDFSELCTIIGQMRNLPTDFWKEDPLYIKLSGALGPNSVADSESYDVAEPWCGGLPSITIDRDADGCALGIEFL